jgi:hypothetical protein
MNWIQSLFIAVLTGGLGLFAAGFVGAAYVNWYRVSSFEGLSGYVMAGIALLGGLVGLIVAGVIYRLVAAGVVQGFFAALGWSCGIVLSLAGVSALILWLLADIPPKIDGQNLELQVEIKLPVGETNSPADATGEATLTLGSVVNHVQRKSEDGELKIREARLEQGRWIIPGSVPIFTTRGLRSIDAKIGGKSVGGFIIPLPARPGKQFEQWSDWMPRQYKGNTPWPETMSSYRFRIHRIVPPPPGPSPTEIAATASAKEQAEFDALSPEAPIKDWLRYTRYGTENARLQKAVASITAHSNYVAELSELMSSQDDADATDSLRVIEHIPQPSPALVPVVREAGKNLAALMRKVNATTRDEDPSYVGAAQVSVRFSAWMVAVRSLHEKCSGDFTPELRTILELSRVRKDSYVMQQDVCRVASYYMKEWAGLAPLPSDPKPN